MAFPLWQKKGLRDGLQKFLDMADGDVKTAKKAKKKSGDCPPESTGNLIE